MNPLRTFRIGESLAQPSKSSSPSRRYSRANGNPAAAASVNGARARLLPTAVFALALLAFVGCGRIAVPEGWSGGVIGDDKLFIGTSEGEVRAIDFVGGWTEWQFTLQGEEQFRAVYGTPAVASGALYVSSYDGRLYAFSLDGQVRWIERLGIVEPPGDALVGGPAVSDGVVLVGSSDGNVYALVAEDGSQLWQFNTNGKVWSTPAVSDGIAYFGSLDHSVYAVGVQDGSQQWRFSAGGAVAASPVVHGGRVYVGAFDSVFYALNARTGREEWRFDGATNWYWGQAVVHDDTVFAPSLDGTLYALNASTGDLRWRVDTEGPIVGAPAMVIPTVVAKDPMLAVGSSDGKVRLISLGGTVLGVCNIYEEIRTPIVSWEDFIYFGARDRSIRSLFIELNGNPDEEWVHFTNQDNPPQTDQPRAC